MNWRQTLNLSHPGSLTPPPSCFYCYCPDINRQLNCHSFMGNLSFFTGWLRNFFFLLIIYSFISCLATGVLFIYPACKTWWLLNVRIHAFISSRKFLPINSLCIAFSPFPLLCLSEIPIRCTWDCFTLTYISLPFFVLVSPSLCLC